MTIERLTPERRRAQTRSHLLSAAAEVFAKRGYHAATLDEIADVAGFSKGAVYSNFSSKADLFLALSSERERQLIDAFGAVSEVDALRAVYAESGARDEAWALSTEFTLYALRDTAARKKLKASTRAGHELVTDLVRRQCEEDGIDPPLAPELIARIYMALFSGLWQQQAIDPDSVSDDVFPEAVLFVRHALAALGQPARKTRKLPTARTSTKRADSKARR